MMHEVGSISLKACTGIGCELKRKCLRWRDPASVHMYDYFYLPLAPVHYVDHKAVCPKRILPHSEILPTMIDRKRFYDTVRPALFHGNISQAQVNGMEAILNEWESKMLIDARWLAYMMATVFHETGKTMQPVEERGRGAGMKYGKKLKHSGVPYMLPDKIYYGRGLVQLTWYENYELMGRLLGIDLLSNPEMALQMKVSVQIMFEGMMRGASSFGDFTGKCLEMYFNDHTCDWENARKIINGVDQAKKIADYAVEFYKGLL